MKIAFEGIGQWAATFACADVQEGGMVKISGNGSVAPCKTGEEPCGQAVSVSRDGGACTVQLGGFVTANYTGESAPAAGWCAMSADGSGGMKADEKGRSYLVAEVDEAAKTVTFVL